MKRHVETIGTIIEWHETTFPDETMEGQCQKFEEEFMEVMTSKSNEERLKELADLFIVACGIFRFDTRIGLNKFAEVYGLARCPGPRSKLRSWSPQQVWDAVVKKMEINRNREWKKTGEGVYRHTDNQTPEEVEQAVLADIAQAAGVGFRVPRFSPMFDSQALQRLERELVHRAWTNVGGFTVDTGDIDG